MTRYTTTLGAIVEFARGVIFDKSQQQSVATAKNVPVLRAGNIQTALNTSDDLIFIPRELVSSEQLFRMDDIAICLSSGSSQVVGKTARLEEEWFGTIGGFCGIIRPKGVDAEFLSLWLRGPQYLAWRDDQARGANIQNLRFSQLADLEIRLPSLSEQRAISVRLKSQLFEAQVAREAVLAQSSDLVSFRIRVLQEVFAGLQDAPRKVLGDHAPTNSGTTPSRGNKAYWSPAEVPWVKTGEVAFAPITATEEAVSRLALKECSLSLLPPKTVLVAMIGQGKTRGQSSLLEIEATTNQNCFAVLPSETWQPEFLYYWFVANYQNLRNLSSDRGGSQSALNGALLKALEVPAPDPDTQGRIVQRVRAALAEVDTMQAASQQMLKDLEQLPSRILAQAFDS